MLILAEKVSLVLLSLRAVAEAGERQDVLSISVVCDSAAGDVIHTFDFVVLYLPNAR